MLMKIVCRNLAAIFGLIFLLLMTASCNSLINANVTVDPFSGNTSGDQVLYLGINDATKCGGCADNNGIWNVTIKTDGEAGTVSMQVDSTVATWQSTGLIVSKDDHLSIIASGQIRYTLSSGENAEFLCGPDGIVGDTSSDCYLAPGLPRNSLVARIGTGKPFAVGSWFESTTVPHGERNYTPPDPSTDYFPLSIGSQWFLRDAKGDWLPTHHASSTILQTIDGTTTINGVDCFVLKTQVGDQPAKYVYLHRTKDAVYAYGYGTDTAMTTYSSPILEYCLPYEQGNSWSYQLDGTEVTTTVLFQEMIAISSSSGYPAQIYQSCWKLQIERDGRTDYEWYAPGVGRVKYVTDSINYELVSHEIGHTSH
jgi:hypothetical protein